MEINQDDLKKYFNEFIKPYATLEFIQKSMLIPYLPKEILEKEYPEVIDIIKG